MHQLNMYSTLLISCMFVTIVTSSPFNFTSIGSGFPTTQEQVSLLSNVQEVFEQVRTVVADETQATDESVATDVEGLVNRGREILMLYQELVISRITAFSKSSCATGPIEKTRESVKEGRVLLNGCSQTAIENVIESSLHTKNTTNAAMVRGQELLDELGKCSKKPAFQLVPCYKRIIDTDVVPVKKALLEAINGHKLWHMKAIEIRNEAAECVDTIVEGYKVMVDRHLKNALNC
ncbi:uncharacterized protein LOC126265495 [Aethina tumida]|uniref:uncharacterized protein LOC126265495 n=1 Tax=Aethina tumida TaxID=116153 RepID=UPI0021498F83|nr:uncharacterized protein LOC126265495 [Aethina tumida]